MTHRAWRWPLALVALGVFLASVLMSGADGRHYRLGLASPSHTIQERCASGSGIDCPEQPLALTYHGGAMLQSAKLYLVNFVDATNQSSEGAYVDGSTTLVPTLQAMTSMVSSRYTAWWSEFSHPESGQFVSAPVAGQILNLAWMDPSQPGTYFADEASISDSALNTAMAAAASGNANFSGLPAYSPTNVLIYPMRTNQSVCSDPNDCANQSASTAPAFCGYHSTAGPNHHLIPYVVLPAVADRFCGYANESVTAPSLAFDDMTSILSHEVAETVTDPYTDALGNGTAWFDPLSQAEVADACAADGIDPVTTDLTPHGPWVQDIFSPVSHSCISFKTLVSASVQYQSGSSHVRVHLASRARVSGLRIWVFATTPKGRVVSWSQISNSHGNAVVGVGPSVQRVVGVWVAGSATRMAIFVPVNQILGGAPMQLHAATVHTTKVEGLANATVSVTRNGVSLGTVQLDGNGNGVITWIPFQGKQLLTFSSDTNGMRSITNLAVDAN